MLESTLIQHASNISNISVPCFFFLFSFSNQIWDMDKKECVHTLEHESAVFQVVSHPNLPVLITGTKDGDVHAWSSNDFR